VTTPVHITSIFAVVASENEQGFDSPAVLTRYIITSHYITLHSITCQTSHR